MTRPSRRLKPLSNYEIHPLSGHALKKFGLERHPLCEKMRAEMNTQSGPELALFFFCYEEEDQPLFDNPYENNPQVFSMPYLCVQENQAFRPLLKAEIAKQPSLAEAALDQVDLKDPLTITRPFRVTQVFSENFSQNPLLFLTLIVTPNIVVMFEDPDKASIDVVHIALPKPDNETAHQTLQRTPDVQREFKNILSFFEATWPREKGKLTLSLFQDFCNLH